MWVCRFGFCFFYYYLLIGCFYFILLVRGWMLFMPRGTADDPGLSYVPQNVIFWTQIAEKEIERNIFQSSTKKHPPWISARLIYWRTIKRRGESPSIAQLLSLCDHMVPYRLISSHRTCWNYWYYTVVRIGLSSDIIMHAQAADLVPVLIVRYVLLIVSLNVWCAHCFCFVEERAHAFCRNACMPRLAGCVRRTFGARAVWIQ